MVTKVKENMCCTTCAHDNMLNSRLHSDTDNTLTHTVTPITVQRDCRLVSKSSWQQQQVCFCTQIPSNDLKQDSGRRNKKEPPSYFISYREKCISAGIKNSGGGTLRWTRQLIKVNRKLDDSAKGKTALCKRWKQIWNLSASLNIAPEGLRESFHF